MVDHAMLRIRRQQSPGIITNNVYKPKLNEHVSDAILAIITNYKRRARTTEVVPAIAYQQSHHCRQK